MSGGSRMQFGPWVVLRRLGEGGFGVVYECQHIEDRRSHAAVKVLMRGTGDERMRERFFREHAALLRMTQEGIRNVPQVLEALGDPRGEHPYYAMDFVHGTNFEDLLYDGFEPRTVVRQLSVVARTLSRAHALQLYHRDLKPSNLLLDTVRNEPVVVDFGSVRMGDDSKFTMVGRGDLGLTPKYAPPEALERATSVDASAEAWDAYSMGMVLHDYLSGQPIEPPDEVNAAKGALLDFWLQRKLRGPVELPDEPAAIWPDIAELIGRLTDPEPGLRPPMLHVAEVLEAAAARGPRRGGDSGASPDVAGRPANTIVVEGEDSGRHTAVQSISLPVAAPKVVTPVSATETKSASVAAAVQVVAPVLAPEPDTDPAQGRLIAAAIALAVFALVLVGVIGFFALQAEVSEPVVADATPAPTPEPAVAVVEPLAPEVAAEEVAPLTPTPRPAPGSIEAVVQPTPAPTPPGTPVVATPTPPAGEDPAEELRRRLRALYDEGPDAAAAAIADPARLDDMLGALASGGQSKDPEVKQMAASISGTLWGQVRRLGPGSKEQLAQTLAEGRRLERFAALPEAVEAGGAVGLAPFLVDEVAARAPKTAADVRSCRGFRALLRQVSGELDGTQGWLVTACQVCGDGGAPLSGYCSAAPP